VIGGASIIGCGLVGRKRAVALEARDICVASIYDPNQLAAQALAESLRRPAQIATSLDEALSHPGVDLVVVATTHSSLAPAALRAVEAGRPVLVEKPGADSYRSIERLASAAERRNAFVRVGFNHRFHPGVQRAKELIDTADLGPLMNIRARYGHGGRVGYEREWRADPSASGGGELLDQGVHLIDLTRFLCDDEVDLAYAELRTDFWPMEVEDNAFLALRCRRGGFAWLHASWTEWTNLFSMELAFRHAKLELTGLGGSYGTERLSLHRMRAEMGPPDTTTWEWPRGDESWSFEIDDVLSELDGTRPARGAHLSDASAALRIVAEAYAR